MVTADGSTREFPVRSLPVVIGRSVESKLRVPLASVSRQHCELVEDDDELVVRDLKSSNGTFVNKERIKSRELLPGDLLAVGPVVFVVKIDGFPKEIDPGQAYSGGSVAVEGGGAAQAIDGVPTWSGQMAPQPAAAKQPAPAKPAAADDDDPGVKELTESDFDIDFGEDDDDKK
jgi:predicted component of type VI protein secretion system